MRAPEAPGHRAVEGCVRAGRVQSALHFDRRLVDPAGAYRSWLDHDDVDAESPDLEAQRVAQRFQGVLAGVVVRAAGNRQPPADRAHVHDPTPALTAHPGQHELNQPRRAEEVGLQLHAGVLDRDLLDRALEPVSGIVHQHPDRSLDLLDGLDGLSCSVRVAHVELQEPATVRRQLRDRLRSPRSL